MQEYEYLNLVRKVLKEGVRSEDRTGKGTLSVFGTQSRYDLKDWTLPLLTTKKMFARGIIEELLWFVRGCTDSKELSSKGVKIWDANGSRSFLDSNGFHHRNEGDLGPVYGFQWRHFGAEYVDSQTNYENRGVDQLREVIETIKTDPYSRRIMMCSWNAKDVKEMVLPPCHCLVQFYVRDGKLSSQLYQRSGDVGLGVPFNIASYSILTMMIAHVTNLQPGEFVHVIGDAHVYLNHVSALKEQLRRNVEHDFPTLSFKRSIKDIDDFKYEDFVVNDYVNQGKISMEMAV